MSIVNPRIVVLACGKGGCCPQVEINEDGSVDIVDQDDGKDERVHLSADQTNMLRDVLAKKG